MFVASGGHFTLVSIEKLERIMKKIRILGFLFNQFAIAIKNSEKYAEVVQGIKSFN